MDYSAKLEAIAKKQRRIERKTNTITTASQWRYDSYGSAETACASLSGIESAIAESLGLNRYEVKSMMNWF